MGNIQHKAKGSTMTITITPKQDRRRELTHAETVVATNSKGQQLCRPKYGFRWTIQDTAVAIGRTQEGWTTCIYIDCERRVRAMWDAHYAGK